MRLRVRATGLREFGIPSEGAQRRSEKRKTVQNDRYTTLATALLRA
jgi:hypothetical protein